MVRNDWKSAFATNLKKARDKTDISLREVASGMNISHSSLSQWENAHSLPNLEHFRTLCELLGSSADQLLELTGQAETLEAGGLRWRVIPPLENNSSFQKEVKDGIKIFRRIVQEGLTSNQIRETKEFAHFGTSRLRRLLKLALFSGAIQIVDVETDDDRRDRLKIAFADNLRECIVAKLDIPSDQVIDSTIRTEAVAFLAARDTLESIRYAKSVGLVGGTTIARFVDLVPPASPGLNGITWLSLLAAKTSVIPIGASANSVVSKMVYNQPGAHGYLMPFINAQRRASDHIKHATRDEIEELENAHFVLDLAQNVELAYVSVGARETNYRTHDAHLSLPELNLVLGQMPKDVQSRCVGDVLLTLIDSEGNRLGTEEDWHKNDAFVCTIGLEGLKNITTYGLVWVLASSSKKADVVRAVLTAGLVNSLVIEDTIADALLN